MLSRGRASRCGRSRAGVSTRSSSTHTSRHVVSGRACGRDRSYPKGPRPHAAGGQAANSCAAQCNWRLGARLMPHAARVMRKAGPVPASMAASLCRLLCHAAPAAAPASPDGCWCAEKYSRRGQVWACGNPENGRLGIAARPGEAHVCMLPARSYCERVPARATCCGGTAFALPEWRGARVREM